MPHVYEVPSCFHDYLKIHIVCLSNFDYHLFARFFKDQSDEPIEGRSS